MAHHMNDNRSKAERIGYAIGKSIHAVTVIAVLASCIKYLAA